MIRRLILLFLFAWPLFSFGQQSDYYAHFNFSSFTTRQKNKSIEYSKYLSAEVKDHPEAGSLPYRRPPVDDCFEVLQKRDAFSRYFIKENSNGSRFFLQRSEAAINYQDKNGFWREIDHRLKKTDDKIFIADQQPSPVSIDLVNDRMSVVNGSDTIFLLGKTSLNIEEKKLSHSASSIKAGDDGVYISEYYPGIDLVYTVRQGSVEFSFVIREKLSLGAGELVMEQPIEFTGGLEMVKSSAENKDFSLIDRDGREAFYIGKSIAFDHGKNRISLKAVYQDGKISVHVPSSFLNASSTIYPVIIDPTVTASNTLPLGSITGSGFGASCFTGGCNYNLSVNAPANATITNMYFSFEYLAVNGLCNAEDGGFTIDYGSCRAPSTGAFSCQFPLTNFYCTYTNQPLTEFVPCFPGPACIPQQQDFVLNFYRCNNDPSAGCSNSCIAATQPWIMTIEGETIGISAITPPVQICSGDNVSLQVVAQYGVQPYAYLWSNSASTDTTTVNPVTSGSYTVTVTDVCGNTASASVNVTISANTNQGFSISPASVCVNEPVRITANGAGLISAFDWFVPGAGFPGNTIQDDNDILISYSIAGTYPITLSFTDGSCTFDSTLNVTVVAPAIADVTLTAIPATAVCSGIPITFSAAATNGGTNPSFTWLINGTTVQTGANTVYTSSTLTNGDLVQVILTSSSSCVSPQQDTASLFAPVNPPVTPSVTITSNNAVCEGDLVTFTANPINGGGGPNYSWQVNGVNVGSGPTYTSSTLVNGDIVAVTMTTSAGCATTPTASSQITMNLQPNSIPDVVITATPGDTICAGQQVTVEASLNNPGIVATYQWMVNGILTGATGSTFTSNQLRNGDIVQAIAIGSGQCFSVNRDTSNLVRIITRAPISVSLQTPAIVCPGVPLTITASASGGTGVYYYNWNVSPIDASSITFTPTTGTTVMVAVTDLCTRLPGLDTLSFQLLTGPEADFTYSNPQPGSFNNILQFENTSVNAVSYLWTFFDLNDTVFSTDSDPQHQFEEQGEYDVLLISQSGNGCIDSIRYTVIVREQLAIYIPNAFTPDGDLVNDEFGPIGASVTTYNMKIYSRWGDVIFDDNDKLWNGSVNGKMVPQGIYLYRIDTGDEVRVGRVAVVR